MRLIRSPASFRPTDFLQVITLLPPPAISGTTHTMSSFPSSTSNSVHFSPRPSTTRRDSQASIESTGSTSNTTVVPALDAPVRPSYEQFRSTFLTVMNSTIARSSFEYWIFAQRDL
ncbi:hypothetical protein BC830DRAFT_1168961 [Chytriomyces sp. MP71]|nr:hypothetical protein BC830DRAFT_1168961 [Chytriomyces sp. MP71]